MTREWCGATTSSYILCWRSFSMPGRASVLFLLRRVPFWPVSSNAAISIFLAAIRLSVFLPVVFSCRVPALNTDPAFIKDMADMVVEALALPTLTVSEVRAYLDLCFVSCLCVCMICVFCFCLFFRLHVIRWPV